MNIKQAILDEFKGHPIPEGFRGGAFKSKWEDREKGESYRAHLDSHGKVTKIEVIGQNEGYRYFLKP